MPARAKNVCDFPYSIAHRNVKYPRLEFKTGTMLVILPNGQDEKRILQKHSQWINRKYRSIQEALDASLEFEIDSRSQDELKRLVHEIIIQFSQDLGNHPSRIVIKKMSSKWASCSKKGTITINSLLRYLPGDLIEYVIFHELIHLTFRKHDESFWKCIDDKFQNVEELEQKLLIYWFLIQKK